MTVDAFNERSKGFPALCGDGLITKLPETYADLVDSCQILARGIGNSIICNRGAVGVYVMNDAVNVWTVMGDHMKMGHQTVVSERDHEWSTRIPLHDFSAQRISDAFASVIRHIQVVLRTDVERAAFREILNNSFDPYRPRDNGTEATEALNFGAH